MVENDNFYDEGNAYATTDDWTLQGREDRAALTDSLRSQANNFESFEDDIQLDDDVAPIPLGQSRGNKGTSNRSFNSLSAKNMDSVTTFNSRSSSKANLSSSRGLGGSNLSQSTTTAPQSALRPSRRGLGLSKDGGQYPSKSSGSSKSATAIRAIIALICLVVSIILALLVGYGVTGLWITETFMKSKGTNIKEPTNSGGIPGSLGQAPVYNSTFDIPNLEEMRILLPVDIENGYADWRIPFPASNRSDLPVFWNVNKNGGTVIQKILGQCLGLIEFSNEGASHDKDPSLQVMETPRGTRFINVDSTSQSGLERAKKLELVQSGLPDVMFTPLIIQAADIFTPENPGRLFTIFRNPLERSMGIYQDAKIKDPSLADMTLADFAANYLPNNELVRTLSGRGLKDDLTDDDLFLAMEIIRRKMVVGLVGRTEESMIRFQAYFGWISLLVDGVSQCQKELLAPASEQRIAAPKQGSEAYNIMVGQNRLDLRLYDYALYMYDVQGGNARPN